MNFIVAYEDSGKFAYISLNWLIKLLDYPGWPNKSFI